MEEPYEHVSLSPSDPRGGSFLTHSILFSANEQKLQYSGSPTSVAKFLSAWIDTCWNDFKSSKQLRSNLLSYISTLPQEDANKVKLACVRHSALHVHRNALGRKFLAVASVPLFDPDSSSAEAGELKISARVKWFTAQASVPLHLAPEQLVEQLVQFEQSLFRRIEMSEFFGKAWQGDGKEKRAPHITALTRAFNYFSYWVTSSVCDHMQRVFRSQATHILICRFWPHSARRHTQPARRRPTRRA